MSVEDTKVVDLISVNSKGKVVLTISDHLIWDSKNYHLTILQDKINSYVKFIENGDIYDKYPKALNCEFIIQLVMKYDPNEDGIEFLIRVDAFLHDLGYDFDYCVVKD